MFVWTGILLDNQLEELKNDAIKIEKELGLKLSCHELPSHISLKISFFIEDEKFDFDFSMIVISSKSLEAVKKVIANVSEIKEVIIEEFVVPSDAEVVSSVQEEKEKPSDKKEDL